MIKFPTGSHVCRPTLAPSAPRSTLGCTLMSSSYSVSAFMLSLLGRQHQLLGARFFELHASDWLVWEPGPWRPARSILTSNTEATQLPTAAQPARPVGEDALCFELKQVENVMMTVGRGSENHIVINDLTVSREQFVLELAHKTWRVRSRGTPLTVGGVPVTEDGAVLKNNSVILVGDVRITFYTPEGFPRRLQQESPSPSGR